MQEKTIKQKLLRALVSIVLFIILLETGLQLFFQKPVFFDVEATRDEGNYQLSPNPDLIYVPKPNTGEFNAYGQRGNAFPFARQGKERIVVMGNSAVGGLQSVRSEDRFTEELSKRMKEYEIINLGVSGYSLKQEVEYLKTLGIKFHPDYVVWGICCDNLQTISCEYWDLQKKMNRSGKNEFYKKYYQTKGSIDRWLLRWKTYCYLKYYFSKELKDDFDIHDHLDDAEINRLFDKIKNMEDAYTFTSIFVLLPANTNDFDDDMQRLRTLLANRHFIYLDYLKAFGRDVFRTGGDDPFHLNARGNKMLAEKLELPLKQIVTKQKNKYSPGEVMR